MSLNKTKQPTTALKKKLNTVSFEKFTYQDVDYYVNSLGALWSVENPHLVGSVANLGKEDQQVYLFDELIYCSGKYIDSTN